MERRTSKILLVGDDNDNFVVMKSLINDAFTEALVLSSHSGNQALEIVKSEDIDVILIDIPMSKMDGFELCKKIKEDLKLSDISVGLVTSIDDLKINRIKALELGAETLLLRPINDIDFIAQIRALLKIRDRNIKKWEEKQGFIDSIKNDHALTEAIIDSIPGYLFVFDENGKLIKWNKKHESMTGYTSEELSHMTIDKWFDPVDLIKVNAAIKKVFDEGYGEVEANLILKNGEKTIIRSSGVPLFLNNHKYFAGIGLDIAEEKRIENELRKSEVFNRNIIESTYDGFWVVSPNGQLLVVNQAYCEMTGYTKKELLTMNINDLEANESPQDTQLHIKNLKEHGSDLFITRHKKKDGNLIDIEVSATFSDSDGVLFAFCRDITERLQIEEALKASETKFRLITENINDVISVFNISKNKFTYVSPSILTLRGFTVEEALSGSFDDAISEDSTERANMILTNRINDFLNNPKTSNNYIDQIKQPCKDGKDIWVEISTSFNYNTKGELEALSVSRSINEWKNAEEMLKQSEDRYKSLFEYSGLAVGFYKPDGTIISYNQLASQNMGGNIGDFDGKSIYDFFPKESANLYMSRIVKALSANSAEEYTDFVSLKTGDRWFSSTYKNVIDHSGVILGVQVISRDITQAIKMENDLKASEKMYRLITENGNDIVTIYNITKNIHTYISPSVQKMRGFTPEEVRKLKFEDSIAPELYEFTISTLMKNMDDFLHNPKSTNNYRYETRQSCKNGQYVWVEVSSIYQYNDENELVAINNLRNIDERKIAEEKLIHLSYYDQLTDLYNRRFYEEELMRLDTERNLPIALIMADVNGLKLTNDAFGHQAGDELLKNIAQIFKKVCRSDEIISRIGGDEFVILLPKCNESQAKLLIERLNAAISKNKKMNALLSVSIGYSIKESGLTKMNEVFKEAEDDMYRHKLAENLSMRSKNIDLIMNSLFEKSNRERLHSDRVAEICEKIASNMNIDQEGIQQIRLAAVLHDIGKIGISDSILNKNGKLDTSEWEEMRKHSEIGYRILSTVSEFSEIAEYVLSHQERWDGKGYPEGLKGEDIPVQARIIAIADAFDAMTVKRSYRDAMSETEAVAEIKKYAGTQFDPEIARIFVEKVIKLSW